MFSKYLWQKEIRDHRPKSSVEKSTAPFTCLWVLPGKKDFWLNQKAIGTFIIMAISRENNSRFF